MIAVGDRAGCVRLWTAQGERLHTLKKHEQAVLCVAWNRRGDVFVTGCADGSAMAWDGATGTIRQVFEYHTGAVVGIAWQDNISFATGAEDRDVFVCQLGSPVPLRQCAGHESPLSALCWDTRGEFLLTAADDGDLRLWKLDVNDCCGVFRGHRGTVTQVAWAPETAEDPRLFVR